MGPLIVLVKHFEGNEGLPQSDKMQIFFAGFQNQTFRCFAELKDLVSQLGRQYEPLASDFHIKTITSLEEFDEMEEERENGDLNKLMVRRINLIRVNKSLCCFKCFFE